MIYYPARVPEKGEMYLGLGGRLTAISNKSATYPSYNETFYSDNNGFIANTIYFRRGIGSGVDVGCEIKGFLIFPLLIEASVRKWFKINTNLIDGIVFDAGYGLLMGEEIYISAAITHENTFIRLALSRNCYDGFDGSGGNSNLTNTFVLTINHEIRMNKFSIMPCIMYEKSTKYTGYPYPAYTLLMSTENITYNILTESNAVGAGVSITYNF